MKLTNRKHLIAVALLRLYNESKSTKKDKFLADMIVDIYELQQKGILGKQIRKMPKVDEK